jgi:hypothetical protein
VFGKLIVPVLHHITTCGYICEGGGARGKVVAICVLTDDLTNFTIYRRVSAANFGSLLVKTKPHLQRFLDIYF